MSIMLIVLSDLACALTNAAGMLLVKQLKRACEHPPLAQMCGAASAAMSSCFQAPLARRQASLLAEAVLAVCLWPAERMSVEITG